MRPGHYSHWPDCHFADALSLDRLLKRLPKGGGGSRMTVWPTATGHAGPVRAKPGRDRCLLLRIDRHRRVGACGDHCHAAAAGAPTARRPLPPLPLLFLIQASSALPPPSPPFHFLQRLRRSLPRCSSRCPRCPSPPPLFSSSSRPPMHSPTFSSFLRPVDGGETAVSLEVASILAALQPPVLSI